jgi:hypothetical protein
MFDDAMPAIQLAVPPDHLQLLQHRAVWIAGRVLKDRISGDAPAGRNFLLQQSD